MLSLGIMELRPDLDSGLPSAKLTVHLNSAQLPPTPPVSSGFHLSQIKKA